MKHHKREGEGGESRRPRLDETQTRILKKLTRRRRRTSRRADPSTPETRGRPPEPPPSA
jgi:hypothetical protein